MTVDSIWGWKLFIRNQCSCQEIKIVWWRFWCWWWSINSTANFLAVFSTCVIVCLTDVAKKGVYWRKCLQNISKVWKQLSRNTVFEDNQQNSVCKSRPFCSKFLQYLLNDILKKRRARLSINSFTDPCKIRKLGLWAFKWSFIQCSYGHDHNVD